MSLKRTLSLDQGIDRDSIDDDPPTDQQESQGPSTQVKKAKRGRKPQEIKQAMKSQIKNNAESNVSPANSTEACNLETNSSDHENPCVFCLGETSSNPALTCDVCHHSYHLKCCGVTDDDSPMILAVTQVMGWSCKPCRDDMLRELRKLKVDMSEVKQAVNTPIPVDQHSSNQNNMTTTIGNSLSTLPLFQATSGSEVRVSEEKNTSAVTYADVTKMVQKTVREVNLRKRNVIVTGLRERGGENDYSDGDIFTSFCEAFFNTKPRVMRNGTRRLGKLGAKPRRLLVQLESEAAASDLLSSSRSLRSSNDEYVASTVYFNPDLTKEEAARAYERRQERRQNPDRLGRQPQNNRSALEPSTSGSGDRTYYNRNRIVHDENTRSASNSTNLIVCTDSTVPVSSNSLGPHCSVNINSNVTTPKIFINSPALNPTANVYAPPSHLVVSGNNNNAPSPIVAHSAVTPSVSTE